MESVENSEVKMSTRRSKKVKNLEEEVELIFSQEESDEDINDNREEILPKTPTGLNKAKYPTTPTASQVVLQEMLQTPRRSCRKSIRPTQEYDDIVNKSLRSCTRSTKKHLLVTEEEMDEDVENQDGEIIQPKWTPAKVGRVSQKRGRKSRRTEKGKKKEDNESKKSKVKEIDHIEPVEVKVLENILVQVTNEHNEQVDDIENITEHIKINPNANLDKKEVDNEHYNQADEYGKLLEDYIEYNNVPIEDKPELNVSKSDKHDKQAVDNKIDDNDILENHDDLISLVQEEDSQNCKKFEQKSEREEICIVYESNISNNEIKVEIEDNIPYSQNTKNGEKLEDSFGCYLKSKSINISDLGLNLLKDEVEEKPIVEVDNQIKPCEEPEEMPSLIICDDDDEEEDCKTRNNLNETFEAETVEDVKLNETFEAETVEDVTESSEKPSEELMETLQISDDDSETPKKRHRVDSSNTPNRNHISLLNVKASAVKVNPKEIVLRGIRKRSLSVCINENEQKGHTFLAGPFAKTKDRMVSFYSPANQHTIIDELDMMIAKSVKKQKLNENTLNKFVTTRRKRSISLDESIMSTSQISKLPRPIIGQNSTIKNKTQTSTSSSKPLLRTKLPNFAAIHQKQFKKMENLVEHVNRKEERSKNLINSATKLRPVSAQKNISVIKKSSNNVANERPMALKKINLDVTSQMNKSLLNTTTTMAALNRTQDEVSVSKVVNLPDPRLAKITKPIKSGTISRRPPQQQTIRNYLKTSQKTNIEKAKVEKAKVAPTKPTFNLSTSLLIKPTTSSTNFAERSNTSHISTDEKTTSRLQRHMDLFKGRVPTTRAGVASRKNEVLLKGVRSNRRFELQMQHRRNLEQ